jgi:hypothetical protein
MACSNCAIREISPWAPTLSEYETRLQMVDMEVAKLLDGSRLVVELALFGRISPCAALTGSTFASCLAAPADRGMARPEVQQRRRTPRAMTTYHTLAVSRRRQAVSSIVHYDFYTSNRQSH